MRTALISAAVAIFLISLSASARCDEASGRDRLKREVVQLFLEALSDELVSGLKDSGLSEFDAQRVVSRLADEVTECALGVVETAIERSGESPDDVFQSATPSDLGRFFGGASDFDEAIDACLISAVSNAGFEAS